MDSVNRLKGERAMEKAASKKAASKKAVPKRKVVLGNWKIVDYKVTDRTKLGNSVTAVILEELPAKINFGKSQTPLANAAARRNWSRKLVKGAQANLEQAAIYARANESKSFKLLLSLINSLLVSVDATWERNKVKIAETERHLVKPARHVTYGLEQSAIGLLNLSIRKAKSG